MKITYFVLLLLFPICVYGQWIPDKLETSPELNPKDSSRLMVSAEITGFFKNNEYFSPIVKGRTLPGVKFEPKVGYQIGSQVRIDLGITGIYYSGDVLKKGDRFFNSIYARLQYDATPDLHLVLGNLYGGVNHRLLEPLYSWENHYVGHPEQGLQLIYKDKDKKYFADLWVNWERYIEYGDSVPEILTFGLSSSVRLNSAEKRLRFTIPLQFLVHHEGGQIDVSSKNMIVTGNVATGISADYDLHGNFFKSIGFDLFALGYYDKLEDKEIRPYSSGWGLYPRLRVDASRVRMSVGYWEARKFYSFMGEPLFNSFNNLYEDYVYPRKRLVTAKFLYSRRVNKYFAWGAHAETYTDLMRGGETDYSFGVYMRFNGRIF